jgi:hypothetical protein
MLWAREGYGGGQVGSQDMLHGWVQLGVGLDSSSSSQMAAQQYTCFENSLVVPIVVRLGGTSSFAQVMCTLPAPIRISSNMMCVCHTHPHQLGCGHATASKPMAWTAPGPGWA